MFKKFFDKALTAVMGDKKKKDIKEAMPLVQLVNVEFSKIHGLTIDQLRGKTQEFRQIITQELADIDQEIAELNEAVNTDHDMNTDDKEALYKDIDKLIKKRDEELEVILLDLLPEAFAVVKETAKRFKDNPQIRATATDLDRELALIKDHITIEGNQVVYQNAWEAAGNVITWDMVHYDVQLIGGIALHKGKIAEMQTGEGKTLVATLPAYLNGLAAQGVHIVTVNNYLAKRDSEWMGGLLNFLGLTVDCIDNHKPNSPERKAAYRCDVTYGTNNEFGFDYLRDNMTRYPDELVQRKPHYAMIDEVDSVLVDDARTPLIISGPVPQGDKHEFDQLKPRIQKLMAAQKKLVSNSLVEAKKEIAAGQTNEKTGGLQLLRAYRGLPRAKPLIKYMNEPNIKTYLQKAENHYMEQQNKNMHIVDDELFFTIDEKQNTIDLTDKGINLITGSGDDPQFFIVPDIASELSALASDDLLTDEEKQATEDRILQDFAIKSERIHSVQQLLKAYALFEKDVEYIIDEGKVKIVDESTGRVMEGRRYSDGLHQAIEAKEEVTVEAATQTYATVTLQNFFRMYHKLAGMTGTAETEAGEFWEIYKLDVVVIPTNRPVIRDDREDLVYKTAREKYNAVIEEVIRLKEKGRPVLIGTTTVDISELLSRTLRMRGIEHNVLNAKQHMREAEIVAQAGQPGQVTIATNMAGRGTDIKLSAQVKEAGGLAIVGTERHDSRRVDRQLRGRAGRQGDPGSSQFFVSLEDKLMRLFGSEKIAGLMDRMGYQEGEVLQHKMITNSIEKAQKKVEENNFGIRKRLLEYDDVMNAQREVIYKRRRHALFGERLKVDLENSFYDLGEELIEIHKMEQDYEGFCRDVARFFAIQTDISEDDFAHEDSQTLSARLYQETNAFYDRKTRHFVEKVMPNLRNIHEERGEQVERVIIPFTDGKKSLNIPVKLQETIETNGDSIFGELEKNISLAFIDDKWKDHLRKMDNLKQSVQLAVHEQKDPLLIYKLESFELFKGLLNDINREVASFLFRADLPKQEIQQQNAQQAERQEQRQRESEQRRTQAGRAIGAASSQQKAEGSAVSGSEAMEKARNSAGGQARKHKGPVRTGPKVSRNAACPCGSGKKYKHCHGK